MQSAAGPIRQILWQRSNVWWWLQGGCDVSLLWCVPMWLQSVQYTVCMCLCVYLCACHMNRQLLYENPLFLYLFAFCLLLFFLIFCSSTYLSSPCLFLSSLFPCPLISSPLVILSIWSVLFLFHLFSSFSPLLYSSISSYVVFSAILHPFHLLFLHSSCPFLSFPFLPYLVVFTALFTSSLLSSSLLFPLFTSPIFSSCLPYPLLSFHHLSDSIIPFLPSSILFDPLLFCHLLLSSFPFSPHLFIYPLFPPLSFLLLPLFLSPLSLSKRRRRICLTRPAPCALTRPHCVTGEGWAVPSII